MNYGGILDKFNGGAIENLSVGSSRIETRRTFQEQVFRFLNAERPPSNHIPANAIAAGTHVGG
jgi:hypothetical protein